jgi:hypothetical protein
MFITRAWNGLVTTGVSTQVMRLRKKTESDPDQDGSWFRLCFRRRHRSALNKRSISGIGRWVRSLIAENFRRSNVHKLVERAGQGNFIDPVRDRRGETFLFEFVPVRLSNGAANLVDAPWSVAFMA